MEQINARSIFSPATGFIQRGGFDWTCNPYIGCTFSCRYCYAAFLPQNRRPREDWGRWLEAKVNAVALARKQAPKVAGQGVYLSSVTDPYVPAERSLCLTRGILEAMAEHQPPLERRWEALRELKAAGLPVGVCVTPMLPLEDADGFVQRLTEFAPDVLVTQHFHDAGSGFGADTGEAARELLEQRGWTEDDYRRCVAALRKHLHVYEAEAGFFPPGRRSA